MPHKITIHDIARELNLTPGTISRALNDSPRISSNTKRIVLEKAEELKYQPNKIASSLRSGKSHTIGVLIPSAQMNFFGSVVHGIEMMASSKGYSILLYQTEETTALEKKAIETFLIARVDGILASISKETTNFEHYKEIQRRNTPLVFFDRTNEEFDVPSVVIDDYKGAFIATEHLIQKGYSRIGHVAGPLHLKSFKGRLDGYRDALCKHGLQQNDELIYQGNISIESGKEAINYFLSLVPAPDAVFAAEDFTALGVVKGLKERKIKTPDEFGVVGFANESFGEHITPSLSSVDQQTVQMGKEALRLLMEIITDKEAQGNIKKRENIVLEPLLHTRESSAGRVMPFKRIHALKDLAEQSL